MSGWKLGFIHNGKEYLFCGTVKRKDMKEEIKRYTLLIRQYSDYKDRFTVNRLLTPSYRTTGRVCSDDELITISTIDEILDYIDTHININAIIFEYAGSTSEYYDIAKFKYRLAQIVTDNAYAYITGGNKKMNITIQPSKNIKNNWFITETDNPETTIYHGSIEMIVDWVRFNQKDINYACYQNATGDIGFSNYSIEFFLRQLEQLEKDINSKSGYYQIYKCTGTDIIEWNVFKTESIDKDNYRRHCLLGAVDADRVINWLNAHCDIITKIEVYNGSNGLVVDGNSASDALIYFKTLNNAYKSLSQMYKEENDPVRPKHYHLGAPLEKYQVLDVIVSLEYQLPLGEAFCLTNALTYLMRYPKKNGLEDVKKAQFYINKLIELMEKK